jgi:hypothetical protein
MATQTTWKDLLQPGTATDFFARRPVPAFDPATAAYTVGNALRLAELCRLVYRHDIEEDDPPPAPTRASFLATAGLRQRRFFRADAPLTRLRAMLVESIAPPDYAVLVFRGTEQHTVDAVTDLTPGFATLVDTATPAVHRGFNDALDLAWIEIDAELAQLAVPVFYAGHSLGAAFATLAAARRRPAAVYTFGSPRVGNRPFAESLASVAIHRVVDDRDVVTTLPPPALGYKHVGHVHTLAAPSASTIAAVGAALELPPGATDYFARLNDPARPAAVLAGLAAGLKALARPPKALADHAPVNYVDRLA